MFRIRTANILLVSLKGLATEVAKNLVLAGIGSLTIVDHGLVTGEDLAAQFFVAETDIGSNRAQASLPELRKLNPRVNIFADPVDIRMKAPEFFMPFDLIVATDLDFPTLSTLSAAARLSNRPFYAAGTHGLYGYIFVDLIMHEYVVEREQGNRPTLLAAESATRSIVKVAAKPEKVNGKVHEIITKNEIYSPLVLANTSPLPPDFLSSRRKLKQVSPLLSCFRALWEFEKMSARLPNLASPQDLQLFATLAKNSQKELQLPLETLTGDFLKSFLQNLGSELAPVTAFLGGQLAQDAINVLGKREQPIQNFLLFNGDDCTSSVYPLHPIFSNLSQLPAAPAAPAAPAEAVALD